MKALSGDLWEKLSREGVHGEALLARIAAPDLTDRLVAALDSSGNRHLLVRLIESEIGMEDSRSRGFDVVTRELSIPNHLRGRFLDLRCHEVSGHQAFDLIGGEIAEQLAARVEPAPQIVARVLARWRRFWGQPAKQVLTKNQQLGLLAEIWFLAYWMIPRFGPNESVRSWRGPFGARHDFELAGRSVEVKASTSSRGPVHRIHGLDQLTVPEGGKLHCFSLQLKEEAGASITLPSIVNICRAKVVDDSNAVDLFESALIQAEYSPMNDYEYSELKVRLISQKLFAVRDDFPRITRESFSEGLPPGIEAVDYEINLGTFAHLCVAQRPTGDLDW